MFVYVLFSLTFLNLNNFGQNMIDITVSCPEACRQIDDNNNGIKKLRHLPLTMKWQSGNTDNVQTISTEPTAVKLTVDTVVSGSIIAKKKKQITFTKL